VVIAAVASLSVHTPAASAFPWDTDMFRGPALQPMDQAPRVMPPGTLPLNGESPRSVAASTKLLNPLPPLPKYIEQGRKLYSVYCSVCHGPAGKGDGPVKFMLRVKPADLTSKAVVRMQDGYIYGTIRNGTQIMPPFGDALSPHERWRIVLFIRDLQQKSAAPATPTPSPSPVSGSLVPLPGQAPWSGRGNRKDIHNNTIGSDPTGDDSAR
jgi:mono/diheme cytochrome c family protein